MFSFASVCRLQSLNDGRWPRNSSECATSEFTFQASAWSTIFGRTQYAYRLRVYRIQIMGREISWVHQKYWSSGSEFLKPPFLWTQPACLLHLYAMPCSTITTLLHYLQKPANTQCMHLSVLAFLLWQRVWLIWLDRDGTYATGSHHRFTHVALEIPVRHCPILCKWGSSSQMSHEHIHHIIIKRY